MDRGLAVAFNAPIGGTVFVFEELTRHFTPRQITDISLSATYYRALGAMVVAFGVEVESSDVLKIEQDWQKQKARS